jgi:Ca-activated chloride channel family protein
MRFWYLLWLLPSVALAKTERWSWLYNDGVTAYHSNDFAHAAALFESATASPDRALQQRALYNLGNTSYRLGEARAPQAQQLWQRAIKSYESALALDPHDADAKFNHDFVKKKLEELKKQQQQQQQQKQQNQQDKKQDQKKDDQQQKQQQQQQQDSQGQPQKPEDKQSEQQTQQQQQQSQEQQKQEQEKQQQTQKDEQQKQQAQQQKESPPEQQPQPQSGQPENDEKRQAAALLDNLREDERNWNFFPEVQMKDLKGSGEPAKDW